MDCCFGLLGKDYVLLAADGTIAMSIMKITDLEDKLLQLDSNKVFAMAGQASDRNQFGEYIHKNMQLIKYRTGNELSVKESANFIRSEFAQAIRQGPYEVNGLLGGVNKEGQPELYWLDYMGSLQNVTRGAHGYGGYFLLGLLDNQWKKNLTIEEGIEIAKKCAAELRTRFFISQNVFIVKIISKDGINVINI